VNIKQPLATRKGNCVCRYEDNAFAARSLESWKARRAGPKGLVHLTLFRGLQSLLPPSDAEVGFENADAVAGDGNLRVLSILEREDDFAGEPGIDFVDPVNVDQRGAVNAQEARWVEAALEIGNGLIDRVAAAFNDGVGELVLGDEVGDGVEVKKRDALTDARGDATRIVGCWLRSEAASCSRSRLGSRCQSGLGRAQAAEFFEGAGQLRGFYRFNKIVNGVDLEGAECVFVVGGGEDHEGLHGEARKQIEAVDAGHLNVEEEHVDGGGGLRVEIGESLRGVGRSGDDLKIVEAGEQALERSMARGSSSTR